MRRHIQEKRKQQQSSNDNPYDRRIRTIDELSRKKDSLFGSDYEISISERKESEGSTGDSSSV